MSINISAKVKKYAKVNVPRRIKKRKEVNLGLPCGRQKCVAGKHDTQMRLPLLT